MVKLLHLVGAVGDPLSWVSRIIRLAEENGH
jgi:hypothetical protein